MLFNVGLEREPVVAGGTLMPSSLDIDRPVEAEDLTETTF
jgi:hypothetical protein